MKKIGLGLVMLLAFVACKKSTTSAPPAPTSGSPASNIHPSNDTAFNGFFTINEYVDYSNYPTTSFSKSFNATAQFSAVLQKGDQTIVNTQTVDSVKINNAALTYTPQPGSVFYSTPYGSDSASVWQVVGQGVIPSFIYTSNSLRSQYNNYNLLPDTIDHTQNTTLHFNITNTNNFVFTFLNGSQWNGFGVPTGATSLTLTPSMMSSLNIGYIGIQFTTTNYDIERVYGKPMEFVFIYNFRKTVYIK